MSQAKPPGPRVSMLQLLTKSHSLPLSDVVELGKTLAAVGDIAYAQIGPMQMYWINNPRDAHSVLVEQAVKFQKPGFLKKALGSIFGNGLFTSDGDFWKRQRKLMQPAFHMKRIESYARTMTELAQSLGDTWKTGGERAIEQDMTDLTLKIVAQSLFSADIASDTERLKTIRAVFADSDAFGTPNLLPSWIPTPARQRMKKAMSELDSVIQTIIDERRRLGQDSGDLLSMLLEAQDEDNGEKMTDQQVRDEVMTLFIAGHETVASALTWVWYLLSQHPEVEAKVVQEIQAVIGDRLPAITDRLPSIDMVIKETLRLYPPTSGIARETIEKVQLGGYPIKKGMLVSIGIYTMHHDARYFEQPEQFVPARFAKENEAQLQPYTYFPFGGGPRICIGNMFALTEARLVLATLLQRYHLSLIPGQEIVPLGGTTLRPRNGLRMMVVPREPKAVLRQS